MWFGVGEAVAGLTFDETVRAVQLDWPLRRRARPGVQAVNVLGDNHEQFAGAFELGDGGVGGVGLGVAERGPAFELEIPVLDARRFRSHEVVVEDGLAALLHAVRPAKVGNAAAGRNIRAGENQNPFPLAKALDQALELCSQRSQVGIVVARSANATVEWAIPVSAFP